MLSTIIHISKVMGTRIYQRPKDSVDDSAMSFGFCGIARFSRSTSMLSGIATRMIDDSVERGKCSISGTDDYCLLSPYADFDFVHLKGFTELLLFAHTGHCSSFAQMA